MNRAAPSGGRKKAMDNKRLTYIDNMILSNINEYGQLPDTGLAQRLHCPRTLLLSRLQHLLSAGYIYPEADRYVLSDLGKKKWTPLYLHASSDHNNDDERPAFDWTELYIPQEGWQQ